MASDSHGYGALSSKNWNTFTYPPPRVHRLTEQVTVTRSFPPLNVVMPGPGEPGKRMPSSGTNAFNGPQNPSSRVPGQFD